MRLGVSFKHRKGIKMAQHIILNHDGKIKSKENISTEKLNELVLSSDCVNAAYNKVEADKWICNNLQIGVKCFKGKEEHWRPYDDHGYKKIKELEVSNFGRVKITDTTGTYIAQQVEKNYPDEALNKGMLGRNGIGWLIIKKYRGLNVYRLVAETWLEKLNNHNDGWHVHHITNDGYDNRPENLIWMSNEDHNKIKHFPGHNKENYHPNVME